MAVTLFSAADFLGRLRFFAGAEHWGSSDNWNDGTNGEPAGPLYGAMLPIATQLAVQMGNWAAVRLQTRIATAVGAELDLASAEWFTYLPRIAGESDNSFRARITLQFRLPKPTASGIAQAVQAYLSALILGPHASATLGADTSGGVDSATDAVDVPGGLDVTLPQSAPSQAVLGTDVSVGATDTTGVLDASVAIGTYPTVTVFDKQSDPASAALINLAPPQFCVFLEYSGIAPALITVGAALSQQLDMLVRGMMAEGAVPVYASNNPAA